ncbi:MAG: CAP domain-containing protein [Chloroflexi bacterium]|nr:CAP domain-containing protein [Chloroflexota bacterium]
MKKLLALFIFALAMIVPVSAQGPSHDLFLRTNILRGELGLPRYRWNDQLAAAARSHANGLAAANRTCGPPDNCHLDSAGNLARDRARIAGYPGERVHENVFAGGDPSADSAWAFWHGSSAHYRNLTSPNNSEIGIGSAQGAGGTTYFVQVFGHNSGAASGTGASSTASNGATGPVRSGPPAYVLGLDEFGNIRHEVQPGQTIGHILLIYGYTWDEYPYLLEINGMSEADRLNMQPGSVILVPPKDGTYTPMPATPAATATAAATAAVSTATDIPDSPTPTASATIAATAAATREIRFAPVETASPQPLAPVDEAAAVTSVGQLVLLGLAILLQLGIIGGASIVYWRRSH